MIQKSLKYNPDRDRHEVVSRYVDPAVAYDTHMMPESADYQPNNNGIAVGSEMVGTLKDVFHGMRYAEAVQNSGSNESAGSSGEPS